MLCALLSLLAAGIAGAVDRPSKEIYYWYLARWEDQSVVCRIAIQHEGQPTGEEVIAQCGEFIYDEWWATPPCQAAETRDCDGLYLFFSNTYVWEVPPEVTPGFPTIQLTLKDCPQETPENWCPALPQLEFVVTIDGLVATNAATSISNAQNTATCTGGICLLPLVVTGESGEKIQFWATLPDGQQTPFYSARFRVLPSDSAAHPGQEGYRVDVVSSQFVTSGPLCCSVQWGAFPAGDTSIPWLATPADFRQLETDIPYAYLAGSLIQAGLVEASQCPGNGLLPSGYASECGLEAAAFDVYAWQNIYDPAILASARKTGVPAVLLKRLFGQESQFWPLDLARAEFGLGHLTTLGADTLLLWNPAYFGQLCPEVLQMTTCDLGYANLSQDQQAMLQGAALSIASGSCEDCPGGLHFRDLDKKVNVVAQALVANAAQAGHIIRLTTGKAGGELSGYDDLWRFSLVNYNAGPGCLHAGVKAVWAAKVELTWENLSVHLPKECQGAVAYVNAVTAVSGAAASLEDAHP
ncbi:MAG: hypothetical protein HYZ26_09845 [Chloroflexi bacterium]|nr:hypothetical protein [Chloroflexota bacterium]